MPRRNGQFTDRESGFIEALARTGDAGYAASVVGYSPAQKSHAMNSPAITQAVYEHHRKYILGEAIPAAHRVHMELMNDPKCPAAVRQRFVAMAYDELRKFSDEKAATVDIHEMTAEQLANERMRLQAQVDAYERASAAKAIDITPSLPTVFD